MYNEETPIEQFNFCQSLTNFLLTNGLEKKHINFLLSPTGYYRKLSLDKHASEISELNALFTGIPYNHIDGYFCNGETHIYDYLNTTDNIKFEKNLINEYLLFIVKDTKKQFEKYYD